MDSTGPVRSQSDLSEMVELLLDKGVVINADIAVSVGDTELLGVELRAAIASFETAAAYGLEFPEGTDRERIEEAARRSDAGRRMAGGEEARRDEKVRSLARRPGAGGRAESGAGEQPDAEEESDGVDRDAEGSRDADEDESTAAEPEAATDAETGDGGSEE